LGWAWVTVLGWVCIGALIVSVYVHKYKPHGIIAQYNVYYKVQYTSISVSKCCFICLLCSEPGGYKTLLDLNVSCLKVITIILVNFVTQARTVVPPPLWKSCEDAKGHRSDGNFEHFAKQIRWGCSLNGRQYTIQKQTKSVENIHVWVNVC